MNIFEAVKENDIDLLKTLTDQESNQGEVLWALFEAIEKEHIECIKILLSTGIDVNQERVLRKNKNSMLLEGSVLIDASVTGNIDIVSMLLEAGADVNLVPKRNTDEPSALMLAAQEGHFEVVKVLVEAGADINMLRDGPDYALLSAASNGHEDIFNFLYPLTAPELRSEALEILPEGIKMREIEENADPLVCDLTNAIVMNDDISKVKKLLKEGININGFDDLGLTPLNVAVLKESKEIVQLLLKFGADPNQGNADDGKTPLMSCAIGVWCKETLSICSLLLEAGANVNAKETEKGWTPLMFAVKSRVLIENHKFAYLQGIKLLIESGANVNLKNHEGKTALDLVQENVNPERIGYQEVYQMLLDAGATE
ncbi:MAG: ankyrin repeat domain-containing protein [Spirulinaceae cyanobacterium]